MRIGGRLRQALRDPAGLGIGDEQLDRETIPLRVERHPAAVGTEARSDVEAPAARRAIDQQAGRAADGILLGGGGSRGLADGGVPFGRQRIGGGPELAGQTGEIVARIGRRPDERRDRAVAIPGADVGPERVPPAVGKVSRVVEIADVRQFLAQRGVAQPHRRLAVHRPEREVLRHPFHEPEGKLQDVGCLGDRFARILARQVELERVHELMPEHVIGVGQRARHGQDDAALEGLGESAGALADEPFHGVGLAEMR